MLKPITNRAESGKYELPADGWYQIAPLGEFAAQSEGRRVIQVLDAAALSVLANRAKADLEANPAGLLVDYDHESLDVDKSSRAAGWITAIENRADGLYAQIRWSGKGQADVEGGEYRFLSPVFDANDVESLGGGRIRPRCLLNAGLTNDPNLKTLKPLTNRNQNQEPDPMDAALITALGLKPEATTEEAVSAIAALKNRASTAESKVETLAKAQLEAQVEQDLKDYEAVIANRDETKKALLANREGTLAVLRAVKAPANKPALPNRQTGKVPTSDGDKDAASQQKAAAIRNRAAVIQREQHVNYSTAWHLAQAEIGE